MTRKAIASVLLAMAVAAGCGGDSDESGSAAKSNEPKGNEPKPAATLKLSVVTKPGKITFDKKELTAPAGRIGIELINPTEMNHNVRIQTGKKCCFAPGHKDLGGTTTDVGKVTATVNLKPGKYFYLCAVGGHWQLGQRGTLIVQ
jgi:plastocyanin